MVGANKKLAIQLQEFAFEVERVLRSKNARSVNCEVSLYIRRVYVKNTPFEYLALYDETRTYPDISSGRIDGQYRALDVYPIKNATVNQALLVIDNIDNINKASERL